MQSPLQRIYKLKVTLLAVLTAVLGVGLLVLARWTESRGAQVHWLQDLPLSELGSTLFITGAFVVAYDYLDGRDKERRDDERLRRLLADSAPAFRDAVVQGFAADTDDLKRVATPELLDDIATNALALRLGDRQFAQEIYTDVRDQAVRAPERWYDVEVSIRLSSMDERDTDGVPRFDAIIEWEYTVTPSHPVQRFACVSDKAEFRELMSDLPSTSTWYMTPRPGFDASQREAFELLSFRVDGEERPIRRSTRRSGQTYSAAIGEDVVLAGKPVRLSSLYRTITPQSGHCLFIEIPQPARDLSLKFDYTDAAISRLVVTDLVTSSQKARISRLPEQVGGKVLSVDLPGWSMPRAGFTFVWTLSGETRSTPPEVGQVPAVPTTRAA